MPAEPLSAALDWLRPRRGEMSALLRELVEQGSFTEDVDGVERVGARLRRALEEIPSLACEPRRGARYGSHLRARTAAAAAAAPRSAVLLVGHLDTVFRPGTFEGYREEGAFACGPGTYDMKGGLVVLVFALRALEAAGLLRRVPVELYAVADEEVGSPEGGPFLAEAAPRAACALVFESGRDGDAIITQRKGIASVLATAGGRAAHAGNAHAEGVNAIWALARFTDRAQALTRYERGLTVNVGRVEGGQVANTVPDRARAWVDVRFVTPADGAEAVAGLRRAASEAAASVPGARVEIESSVLRPPLVRTPESLRLYEEVAACQRAAGLGAGEAPLLGGGSDANNLSALGVPAVDGLGPRGSGFHTDRERIELDSLVPKAESLVRFLARRAG